MGQDSGPHAYNSNADSFLNPVDCCIAAPAGNNRRLSDKGFKEASNDIKGLNGAARED
ncbi:hypothetical protein ACFO1V_05265 [Daeguia caeni]|uniref:Uncharacterized protein n=1 Tax=Daeguia caeni TaxID=439612 RepID=A0ABV9H549_9HYPH